MNYRGMIEVFLSVEANSEEEAKQKMAEILSKGLLDGPEYEFIVWED